MMRASVIFLLLSVAACDRLATAQDGPNVDVARGEVFPAAGKYHIIHDMPQGSDSPRQESDQWLDVSDRAKFEDRFAKPSGNCRDRKVTIAGGSFDIAMTCDAPDGDIRNIAVRASGSYSKDSIDVVSDTTLWGMPFRETYSYRLQNS